MNTIHNTLLLFFLVNAAVSFVDILIIIIKSGALNPYIYQGLRQKYFIGTGDYIKGIFFDTSTTNAIVNAFAVIYFLKRKKYLPSLICMIVLLLTCSNLTNIMLFVTFIFMFIFNSTRSEKSIISICMFMLILFLVKVSPQNNQYSFEVFKNIFRKPLTVKPFAPPAPLINSVVQKKDTANPEQTKQSIAKAHLDSVSTILFQASQNIKTSPQEKIIVSKKPFIPKPNINEPEYQTNKDTTTIQRELVTLMHKTVEDNTLEYLKECAQHTPGKLISLKQTFHFFQLHPAKIFTGTGMGNFSSKMAFRASALKVSGGYPQKYAYINEDFKNNHFAIFLY
ncbi:MAG: hypothetical protein JST96_16715, partial [Bacteroidetes bacterium]|nr:hypothetical protein [Bacteroidota bacterium]